MALAEQAGDAVVDLGTPLAVDEAGGESGVPIGGCSTLRAGRTTPWQSLDGQPHLAMPGTARGPHMTITIAAAASPTTTSTN